MISVQQFDDPISFFDFDKVGISPNRRRVLVIDDDDFFRTTVMELLNSKGFVAEGCKSLNELGRVSLLGSYDLVVLDYCLPDLDGLEIAAYIDAFFDEIPVILVSFKNIREINPEHWPRCVQRFWEKSESIEDLIEAVQESFARVKAPHLRVVESYKKCCN